MEPVDRAFPTFQKLVADYNESKNDIVNEADLRFRLLDTIFTEVLGWPKADIRVEAPSEAGFADYLFRSSGRNVAVVEAKRSSEPIISTTAANRANYLLRGAVLKPGISGINQAKSYASDHSCPFAAVTSGASWIFFLTNRQDGLPFLDSQAIVYPTLESIIADFSVFYDLMSKEGVTAKRYLIHFNRIEGKSVSPASDWHIAVDDRKNVLLTRDKLSQDLSRIFDRFFRSITDETDSQMLIECFVETRESKLADSTMQKLAEEVLSDISAFSSGAGEELQEELASAVEAKLGEIVLIIGSKGSGKSTFIDRFFKVVVPRQLRERCAVIRADLSESTQETRTIESWLTERLIPQLEDRLFKEAAPTFDDLQGMYYAEYHGWKVGELRYLFENDPVQFKTQFGIWIKDQRTQDRHNYLLRLLKTANTQRLLMPCIVFDNTDQFPQDFQERVFQFAYALFCSTTSFVIVPITDKTIWTLSKSGPLQSYATKSFYLPVPPTKDILERRVAYLRKRSEDNRDEGHYFLSRGIKLNIKSIAAFAATVEEVFVKRDFVARRVSWLANLDLRRCLELMQRIITSPALQIEQLVTAYVTGQSPSISESRITRALVVWNHKYFDPETNSFVQNLFTVSHDRVMSPLLRISILRLLLDRLGSSRDDQSLQYMDINAIMSYFEPAGVRAVDVSETVSSMISSRLIEPYTPGAERLEVGERVRIANSGRIHLEMALQDQQYICQMAMRTQIRSATAVSQIVPVATFPSMPSPWTIAASSFSEYLTQEDARLISLPNDEGYDSQRSLRSEFKRWIVRRSGAEAV